MVARSDPTSTTGAPAGVEVCWLPVKNNGTTAPTERSSDERSDPPTGTQQEDARFTAEAIRGLGARAVVVDRYGLDGTWESEIRDELGLPVIAIDGLADRRHTADLVIDPTYVANPETRWHGLLGVGTRLLRGPRYALIAPHFREQLGRSRPRNVAVRRVLISFGGSDPGGLTERALDAVEMLTELDLYVDAVVGAVHPSPQRIRERCEQLRATRFHHATTQMADLMAEADLALGSGGITTYERAFLGLPAIVVVAAENQMKQVSEVASTGAIMALGSAAEVGATDIASALKALANDPARAHRMSTAARAIMGNDTVPGSVRVAEEVAKLL